MQCTVTPYCRQSCSIKLLSHNCDRSEAEQGLETRSKSSKKLILRISTAALLPKIPEPLILQLGYLLHASQSLACISCKRILLLLPCHRTMCNIRLEQKACPSNWCKNETFKKKKRKQLGTNWRGCVLGLIVPWGTAATAPEGYPVWLW